MTVARLPLVALAIVCAVLGIYLAVSSADEGRLGRANAAVLAGRDDEALAELEGLEGEPARRAAAVRARAHIGLGELRRARRDLQQAARRDPNNWVLQRDYAIILLRLGRREKAKARMQRARALNPLMVLAPGFTATK